MAFSSFFPPCSPYRPSILSPSPAFILSLSLTLPFPSFYTMAVSSFPFLVFLNLPSYSSFSFSSILSFPQFSLCFSLSFSPLSLTYSSLPLFLTFPANHHGMYMINEYTPPSPRGRISLSNPSSCSRSKRQLPKLTFADGALCNCLGARDKLSLVPPNLLII